MDLQEQKTRKIKKALERLTQALNYTASDLQSLKNQKIYLESAMRNLSKGIILCSIDMSRHLVDENITPTATSATVENDAILKQLNSLDKHG